MNVILRLTGLLCALTLLSCSTGGHQTAVDQSPVTESALMFPQGNASRQASLDSSFHTFEEADIWRSDAASMSGHDLELQENGLSWAIFGLGLQPGQSTKALQVSGIASGVWVGYADYTSSCWQWLGTVGNGTNGFVLPTTGTQSTGGSCYFVLACPAGDMANVQVMLELQNSPVESWNFLVYIAGDNNLAQAAVDDLNEMESIDWQDNTDINVLAAYDIDSSRLSGTVSGLDKIRFIKVLHNRDAMEIDISHPANQEFDWQGYDSSDPVHLTEFLEWAEENFPPADRTALVLWDHGDGWRVPSALPAGNLPPSMGHRQASGVLSDYANGGPCTANAEIVDALGERHFDLICFDACNMAHFESLYEYRNHADYLVASEIGIPFDGYAYDQILGWMKANFPPQPSQCGQQIVDSFLAYYQSRDEYVTLALFDSAQLPPMTALLAEMAQIVTSNAGTEDAHVKSSITASDELPDGTGERDLLEFCQEYRGRTSNVDIQNLLDAIIARYPELVVYARQHLMPDTNGLPVFLPDSGWFGDEIKDEYRPLAFNQATNWLEMFEATGVPSESGIPEHSWEHGWKVVIEWTDHARLVDILIQDPDENLGWPENPGPLGGAVTFQTAAGHESATLEPGAGTGWYWFAAYYDYLDESGPDSVTVSAWIEDESGAMVNDLGEIEVNKDQSKGLAWLWY